MLKIDDTEYYKYSASEPPRPACSEYYTGSSHKTNKTQPSANDDSSFGVSVISPSAAR